MFNNKSNKKTIEALKRAIKEKDKIIHRYMIVYGEVDVSDEEQLVANLVKLKKEYESLIEEIKEQKKQYEELNSERIKINSEIKKMIGDVTKIS